AGEISFQKAILHQLSKPYALPEEGDWICRNDQGETLNLVRLIKKNGTEVDFSHQREGLYELSGAGNFSVSLMLAKEKMSSAILKIELAADLFRKAEAKKYRLVFKTKAPYWDYLFPLHSLSLYEGLQVVESNSPGNEAFGDVREDEDKCIISSVAPIPMSGSILKKFQLVGKALRGKHRKVLIPHLPYPERNQLVKKDEKGRLSVSIPVVI
ncbi:MAG: hypothetical protein MI784_03010, partial [Cytophagales bacterium]|nr:hypothetical protein [Cytophagales bacterium]